MLQREPIVSPNVKYLLVDVRYESLFLIFHTGSCHSNQFKTVLDNKPSFGALEFQTRLEYRNSDLKRLNDNILATYYVNLMKIGPVTRRLRE